ILNAEAFCEICERKFKNSATLKHHKTTKKHINREQVQKNQLEGNEDTSLCSSNDEESTDNFEINENTCLFCLNQSNDLATNLNHMKEDHAYMPVAQEYLIDTSGLLFYLATIIFGKCICIQCCKEFPDSDSVQSHMLAKNHSNLDIYNEEFLNFLDFYQFPDNDEMYLYRPKFEVMPDGRAILPNGNIIFSKYANSNRKLEKRREFHQKYISEIKALDQDTKKGYAIVVKDKKSASEIERHKSTTQHHKLLKANKNFLKKQMVAQTKDKSYIKHTMRKIEKLGH
ncbi:MAG: hypothetical protein MHPSP_003242, partial [Paramarteilia canceri]